MKVVIAIDSFKGSLSSMAAGNAAASGVRAVFPEAQCVVRPLADGGEGTTAAMVAGMGGEMIAVTVTGPAGDPVVAHYGMLPEGTAVIEMAEAAGITLVSGDRRDPLHTTTFGVGEMMLDAIRRGARSLVMGIGGSATNDAGAGMLQALGFRLLDDAGVELPRGGGALSALARIEPPENERFTQYRALNIRVACDVTNPLCGENGASAVFGPQKGASPDDVKRLDAALAHFAELGGGCPTAAGAGAAGGMGYALKNFLSAELMPGVELVLKETKLDEELGDADIVITGEGRLDGQTVMGKAPIGVARLAKRYGKTVLAFSGCLGEGVEAVNDAGIDAYFPILRQVVTLDAALREENAAKNLAASVEQAFRLWRKGMEK